MTNEGETTQVPTIGERQTVDRAKHPILGEGVAVYDNGPSFFRSDGGAVEHYARLGLGGCGVGGSWLRAITVDGAEVQLDVAGREHGERHWRIMTHDKTRGWMVQVAKPVLHWRWEPDGGTPIAFEFDIMRAGTPGAMKRQVRRKNFREMPYEQYWSTFTARDGKHFVWCNESDADKVSWPKGKAES